MNNQQFWHWCEQKQAVAQDFETSPLVMGILNVTPDSFSDGGAFVRQDLALRQARAMIDSGADMLDIGGESTRPGSQPVGLNEELDRVLPVIEGIRRDSDICLSIDTSKPEVMRAAVGCGAGFINDVRALRETAAIETARDLKVPVCLMHMRGIPGRMQDELNHSSSVMTDIHAFFQKRIKRCVAAGLSKKNILLDPGFGFGKSVEDNLEMINHFGQFKRYKLPLMLGVSRKSTLGLVLNKPVHERTMGSIALQVMALMQGLDIIRTHDVGETQDALKMVLAVQRARNFGLEDCSQ